MSPSASLDHPGEPAAAGVAGVSPAASPPPPSPGGPSPREPEDKGVAVSATKTRPLGLKDSSSKAIASAVGASIMPVFQKCAHPFQKGFIRGRNFVSNVLFLDQNLNQVLLLF